MDYENMRVAELKALMREHRLQGYSQLRKAELIALLHPAGKAPPGGMWRPPPSPPQVIATQVQSVRQPSPQEMNIYEQQEMSESWPQVTSKINDWYDWLVNHIPKTIKDGASRAFKTFKDRIMGLYNRVTGNQTQLKGH